MSFRDIRIGCVAKSSFEEAGGEFGAHLSHCDLGPSGLDIHFVIHGGNEAGPLCQE